MEQVVLVALGVLFLIFTGVMLEHYLGPKPKLDTDQLFQAFDLIDTHCEGDYKHVRLMRDELYRWMETPGFTMVSKELHQIIDIVTDDDRTNFE